MHLSNLLDGYFIARRTRLAASTRRNYGYCAAKLLAYFGAETAVETIAAADLGRFADNLAAAGLSPRSVADNLAICSSFWAFAADELGIANVARSVPRPTWKPRPIDPLSKEAVRALLRAAEWNATWTGRAGKPARSKRPTAQRDVAIVLTLVDSGVRASELCALEYRDYTTSEGRLHVRHGKGDKARFVFLGTAAQKALWRYLAGRVELRPSSPLFATRTGRAMDRFALGNVLDTIGRNARIDNVHPHRFRHTFAVMFLRNGGNVFELQRILGHEKLETVQTYLALAQTDLAAAQQRASPADGWRL